MSLLNEMLHDLAKRRAEGHASPLYSATLTDSPSSSPDKKRILIIAISILSGLFIGAVVWIFTSPKIEINTVSAEKEIQLSKPSSQTNLAPRISELPPEPPQLVSYIEPLSVYADKWVSLQSAVDASKVVMNKVYSTLSIEEWHESQLNKALKLIQRGDDERAIRMLESVVAKIPQAIDARENLASLYLNYGDLANAHEITEAGLRYEPENAILLTIQARLLMVQERLESAVQLLSRHHPSMQKYPDYYGTLAAALQSSGKIDEAGTLYKSLLQVEPDNAQYWLGYAIFLEHHHKINQAIDAYTRASQNPESESVVREYAENRLNILQG